MTSVDPKTVRHRSGTRTLRRQGVEAHQDAQTSEAPGPPRHPTPHGQHRTVELTPARLTGPKFTSASSSAAAGWCGRTSSCGSWSREPEGGRSSCATRQVRMRCRSSARAHSPRSETNRQAIREARGSAHMRQTCLSWLNFLASTTSDGSITPPRMRGSRCRVESASIQAEHCLTRRFHE